MKRTETQGIKPWRAGQNGERSFDAEKRRPSLVMAWTMDACLYTIFVCSSAILHRRLLPSGTPGPAPRIGMDSSDGQRQEQYLANLVSGAAGMGLVLG